MSKPLNQAALEGDQLPPAKSLLDLLQLRGPELFRHTTFNVIVSSECYPNFPMSNRNKQQIEEPRKPTQEKRVQSCRDLLVILKLLRSALKRNSVLLTSQGRPRIFSAVPVDLVVLGSGHRTSQSIAQLPALWHRH